MIEELLTPTKQYSSNNQVWALRLEDGRLNHVLPDPTGLSLTMVDENGDLAGRVIIALAECWTTPCRLRLRNPWLDTPMQRLGWCM